MRISTSVLLAFAVAVWLPALRAAQPEVKDIIQRSIAANQYDFEQDPKYNHKERDRNQNGDKSFDVIMIDGWPYNRLIGLNGKPLPPDQEKVQAQKEHAERQHRASMSASERQQAIQKYERDRQRNKTMMQQLTIAFNFQLLGQRSVRGRTVWALKATPRPGYKPPNRDSEVLPGMQGELWIDQTTYQWVRVTASVIHPVSIEGFLATVEPGTHFELDQMPAGPGYWAASHFVERAEAKVLILFNHREHEDDTFWDYTPVK